MIYHCGVSVRVQGSNQKEVKMDRDVEGPSGGAISDESSKSILGSQVTLRSSWPAATGFSAHNMQDSLAGPGLPQGREHPDVLSS